jgi:D-alanyl-D-alanine carboxypeptidase (penicillin-binding protein 5/6)
VKVTLGKGADSVLIAPAESLSALLPNDVTEQSFSNSIEKLESVEAPVEEGQKLGTLTVYLQDRPYGSVDLVAVDSVERSEFLYRKNAVEKLISSTWFRAALAGTGVVILFLILRLTVLRPRRHSKHQRKPRPAAAKPASYKGGRKGR